MGSFLKFLLASLLLFIVVTIAAFVYLEPWQALLVVAGMILAVFFAIKYVMRNLGKILGNAMLRAFETKAMVLRGAEVAIHHVEATMAPANAASSDDEGDPDEDEADEDETDGEGDEQDGDAAAPKGPLAYYRLDVTITPRPGVSEMSHWDVDDLRVVSYDAPKPSLDLMSGNAPARAGGYDEGYDLRKVQILQDGVYVDDDQGKHEGPKQLRATVAVPTHVRELKFQYYAEQFGRIPLPPPLSPVA